MPSTASKNTDKEEHNTTTTTSQQVDSEMELEPSIDDNDNYMNAVKNDAVYHFMCFPSIKSSTTTTFNINTEMPSGHTKSNIVLKVRELPITRADNPFGTDLAPEDDTTG